LIARLYEIVAVAPAASLIVTSGWNDPAVVGLPLINPAALIVKPVGRPLAAHVYGSVPFAAVICWLG
jgi:hypothetical protein